MTDQTSRSGNPVTMAACACLTALCMLLASAALTGCGPSIKMTALVSMMPDQESFFRNEMVPGFERERRAKILVAHYGDPDSLDEYLRAPGSNIGLVKVPFERRTALIEQGLFKPIADILPPEKLRSFSGDYLLTKLGEVHGRPCLIPRKFETRIMVYDRNRVSDALGMWKKYKNELDAAIKRHNGVGLPADYILENDPNKWDYFDFFVVGWIWSHTQFNGKAVGRIGLRGKRYSGTWLGIVDRIYQLGGDSAAVVSMTGDAVIDAFHWEAVYAASGVYNPAMWEKGWSGADIWKAFADGEVFLSFMTQLDCFFLHGTGRDNLMGYFKNPDDMGVALMPQGCSMELSGDELPLRRGRRSITTGGWWWGIPANTPDPAASWELAAFVTSTSAQISECSRFGMVPVRKDVLGDMNMLFGGGWISRIYEISFKQLFENGHTVLPAHRRLGKLGDLYIDAWYNIVAAKNWSPDTMVPQRDHIRDLLSSLYAPRAKRLLEKDN